MNKTFSSKQIFLKDLNNFVNRFFSNFVRLQNSGMDLSDSEKKYEDNILGWLSTINCAECNYQKIRQSNSLYEYLKRKSLSPFSINFSTPTHMHIFENIVNIYFAEYSNKQISSYLKIVMERCISLLFAESMHDLVISLIKTQNNIFFKFSKNIQASILEYIIEYRVVGENFSLKNAEIFLHDAEKLSTEICENAEKELNSINENKVNKKIIKKDEGDLVNIIDTFEKKLYEFITQYVNPLEIVYYEKKHDKKLLHYVINTIQEIIISGSPDYKKNTTLIYLREAKSEILESQEYTRLLKTRLMEAYINDKYDGKYNEYYARQFCRECFEVIFQEKIEDKIIDQYVGEQDQIKREKIAYSISMYDTFSGSVKCLNWKEADNIHKTIMNVVRYYKFQPKFKNSNNYPKEIIKIVDTIVSEVRTEKYNIDKHIDGLFILTESFKKYYPNTFSNFCSGDNFNDMNVNDTKVKLYSIYDGRYDTEKNKTVRRFYKSLYGNDMQCTKIKLNKYFIDNINKWDEATANGFTNCVYNELIEQFNKNSIDKKKVDDRTMYARIKLYCDYHFYDESTKQKDMLELYNKTLFGEEIYLTDDMIIHFAKIESQFSVMEVQKFKRAACEKNRWNTHALLV